jgi:hypothetical protein
MARRALATGVGSLALLIATTVAAAAAGRVAVVNGIPGKTVEVCINGKEVKSGLKYGKATIRSLANGAKTLKLRTNSSGKCTGSLLGTKSFSVTGSTDFTIVGTKFGPNKVILYDNALISDASPGFAVVVLRHAADIGTAGFKYHTPDDGTPWFDAVADDPWVKGAYGWGTRSLGTEMLWWAHQPPAQRAIAGPYQLVVGDDVRHESVLVGSSLGNVKFARFTVPD